MKGFPNQIAELERLSQGLQTIVQVLAAGRNPRDDGVLGQAMVRSGVLGTGHIPKPVDQYIREQLTKTQDRQSFRTSARGLRELYRLLGLINEMGGTVIVTPEGHQAASYAGQPLGPAQIEFWRRVISNFQHLGGDRRASHPYQVLLRLVARKPGITRAKCALALEARDDSQEELDRIVELADLPEDEIRERIHVSESNWDNAKKVIPRFAEQLGDVIKTGQNYRLADAPGLAGLAIPPAPPVARVAEGAAPRRPRSARAVTPATIGAAGLAERDEPEVPPIPDPAAAAAAIASRLARLRRHNELVRALATRLQAAGMALFEDPFDVLAVLGQAGILGEVKTLDGSAEDERDRVRDALAQLLYYEAFVTAPVAGEATIHKVAFFERPITDGHRGWLNSSAIATIWMDDGHLKGDELAVRVLGPYLEELR